MKVSSFQVLLVSPREVEDLIAGLIELLDLSGRKRPVVDPQAIHLATIEKLVPRP
jgi:hypothetical protein